MKNSVLNCGASYKQEHNSKIIILKTKNSKIIQISIKYNYEPKYF